MFKRFNPFSFIINRLDRLMTLAQDTKTSADAVATAVTGLTTQVDTLVTGYQSVSQQLAALIAGGTLSDDDTAALNAAKGELDSTAQTVADETAKISAALSAAQASSGSTVGLPTDTGLTGGTAPASGNPTL